VESRYVEYSGSKMVYASPWHDHCGGGCPEGCLRTAESGMSLKKARQMKKWLQVVDRQKGCSNFQYRVAV